MWSEITAVWLATKVEKSQFSGLHLIVGALCWRSDHREGTLCCDLYLSNFLSLDYAFFLLKNSLL